MERRIVATPALVKDYFSLFVNRRAYTVQSFRPHPESGRHYYYRPTERGSDGALQLNEKTISDHLEGKITIGLYAINPSNQCCKWVAIDADYTNAMEDLIKLQYQLTREGVDSALEMSKRGGHLWIFLAVPLLARKWRIYIYDLAGRLGVPVKGSGLAEGIEVFPKHDAIASGAFGNALRGPLGIHRGAQRRFWFYGPTTPSTHKCNSSSVSARWLRMNWRALLLEKNGLSMSVRPDPRPNLGESRELRRMGRGFAFLTT